MTETVINPTSTELLSLTIDGQRIDVAKGTSVLNAARQAGIYIPHLCDHPSIKPYAGCRLCLVEIEGQRGFDTSCTVPAAEGMVVRTDTPAIRETQRDVLEIILSDHPDRCLNCDRYERCLPNGICQRDDVVTDRCVVCPNNRQCELQQLVDFLALRRQRYSFVNRRSSAPELSNPFIERNEDYCIYCTRCVRVCEEVRGISALGPANRGPHDQSLVNFVQTLPETNCEFCGQCALVCPTGAIMKKDSRHGRSSENAVSTVCGHCAVGCGVQMKLNVKDGHILNVRPQEDGPFSQGCLCVKGHFGYDYVESAARLRQPLAKTSDGVQMPIAWDAALERVATELLAIKARHGAQAIGFIASPKATNEENYLLQKLARTVLGTPNIDQVARFSYAPAVEAHLALLGAVGATNPIADIDRAGCLLVAGANPTETHTVLGLAIKRAVRNGAKLILIDPRETPLTRFASLWLRPKLGSDAALINAILSVILNEDLVDPAFLAAHCEGLDALKSSLASLDLTKVAKATGITVEQIRMAARMFARGGDVKETGKPLANQHPFTLATSRPATRSASIFYGAGVIQQANGLDAIEALIDLALITGNLGTTAGGIFPLSGENNTLGACDMGTLAEYEPGYTPAVQTGRTLLEMLEDAKNGTLKALYVLDTDLLATLPDSQWVAESLSKLELLVAQDIFPNATTALAHVVLPGTSFAEKEGSFTNLERRVQALHKAIEPVGEARPDWQILCQLGDKLLAKQGRLNGLNFAYVHPSQVMEEIAKTVPFYATVTDDSMGASGVLQPTILFAEGFGNHKAKLAPTASGLSTPAHDKHYPLTLISGGVLFHQGNSTFTRQSRVLSEAASEAILEINPEDAADLGLSDGEKTKVTSATGSVEVSVKLSVGLPRGMVFLPSFDGTICRLVARPTDVKAMPAFKATAVKVETLG